MQGELQPLGPHVAIRLPRRPAQEDEWSCCARLLPAWRALHVVRQGCCLCDLTQDHVLMNIVIVLILQLHASACCKYSCAACVACQLNLYADLALFYPNHGHGQCDGNRSPCHHFPFPITIGTLDGFETETKQWGLVQCPRPFWAWAWAPSEQIYRGSHRGPSAPTAHRPRPKSESAKSEKEGKKTKQRP